MMNKRVSSVIIAVMCLTAVFLIPARDMRLGAEESSGPPKILHIYGNVTTYPENGKWQALTKDTTFNGNDWIYADPNSYVIFSLNRNDIVTVTNDTLVLREKERVIIMAAHALPSQATKVRSFNTSEWEKWNLQKDTLLLKGDSKSLTTMEPSKTSDTASGSTCKTAAPSSGQSSGSGTPQTPANNFDYQQLRDRIRILPAYKPGL